MYFNDFGDFPSSPLYLSYNPAELKNPVLRIFKFQELSWTKRIWIFGTMIFYRQDPLFPKEIILGRRSSGDPTLPAPSGVTSQTKHVVVRPTCGRGHGPRPT